LGGARKYAIALVFVAGILNTCFLHAQQQVCGLFSNLKAADGSNFIVTGELIISKDFAALGASVCDNRYVTSLGSNTFQQWPTALRLRPSPNLPAKQLQQFQNAGIEADRLRAEGKIVRAFGSFSGRLRVAPVGKLPGELTFDSFDDLRVETLAVADSLPVISICDLFQNLSRWSGKRIAVRGEVGGTFEGTWIIGHCKGAFFTGEYRWPVGLNLGVPAYQSDEYEKLYLPKWPDLPKQENNSLNLSTTATLVGVLNMRSEYHMVCLRNGTYLGNGFGHLNSAAGELIVDTVLNFEVNERTEESSPSDHVEQRCVPSASVPLWP
jgi:hypothetical protein